MQMLELERAGPLFGNQVPTGSLSCKRGVAGLSGRRAVRPAGGRQSMLWTIAELRPQGPQRAFCPEEILQRQSACLPGSLLMCVGSHADRLTGAVIKFRGHSLSLKDDRPENISTAVRYLLRSCSRVIIMYLRVSDHGLERYLRCEAAMTGFRSC